MKELEYPFDSGYIMKKKKSLKRRLTEVVTPVLTKRIAVLGGSTTSDIVSVLELFLLNYGIKAEFYECEYAQYRQEALFPSEELLAFKPDIVFLHTGLRNLTFKPNPKMSEAEIAEGLESEISGYKQMWESLKSNFGCAVVQNNFELPSFRLLGNSDGSDKRGLVNYVTRLNLRLAEEINAASGVYLNDINYLSAVCGLDAWSDPQYWYLYKYSLNIRFIPDLCFEAAKVIKAICGRNKKVLALDLDNTLWGGIVGDDGAENLTIGQETAEAMAYYQWQEYVKSLKDIGVLLTVCSKNEEENALAGLEHPEGALRPSDFTVIKANWEPKSENLINTAKELDILPDAIVLADDNPAEREIVRGSGFAAPDMDNVGDYIRNIDRSGFFEVVSLSADDLKRTEMYAANMQRKQEQSKFADYDDYLRSLEMFAEIAPFKPMYVQRLAQLAGKSNQFNVTTRRYTVTEMEERMNSDEYITLYGKLVDKYGDNGVVSEVIGKVNGNKLDLELWLMSCRVLKRGMEYAMLDELVKTCRDKGIAEIYGYYYPTAKNKMVAELFGELGFEKQSSDDEGNTIWKMDVSAHTESKNTAINVNTEEQ
ncbi:MAG: HAD-IIIC family phosphatase [Ruminococcus sp.]|uniref:HAD-IIIC family phosphatase n=1 Tax=Ruminococcus sp. TaxID=41978 RepID=UPI0025F9ACD2|nr:HAD-IIIC family phosphatase [Ruminococcus sp.]MCR5540344.1 HAD-IIIC family phosphatase [Ruminococcus sp.]